MAGSGVAVVAADLGVIVMGAADFAVVEGVVVGVVLGVVVAGVDSEAGEMEAKVAVLGVGAVVLGVDATVVVLGADAMVMEVVVEVSVNLLMEMIEAGEVVLGNHLGITIGAGEVVLETHSGAAGVILDSKNQKIRKLHLTTRFI